jgi:translation initiation factor 5A
MADKTVALIKDLKSNGFVIIDGVPCRVDRVQSSTSGKHGHAKVRVDAIGLFDNVRKSIIAPSHENIEVPIVEKKRGQVISITGNKAQVMDMNDFSVMEMDIPAERKEKIRQGEEIEYFEVLDIKTLKELK